MKILNTMKNEFEEIRKSKYFKYIVAFGIIKKVILLSMILVPLLSFSQELVIGEERVEPGIVLIFDPFLFIMKLFPSKIKSSFAPIWLTYIKGT